MVSALFLRWYPQWGAVTFLPIALACITIVGVTSTQHRRYVRSCLSIGRSPAGADVGPALLIAGSVAAIGAAGLIVLVFT